MTDIEPAAIAAYQQKVNETKTTKATPVTLSPFKASHCVSLVWSAATMHRATSPLYEMAETAFSSAKDANNNLHHHNRVTHPWMNDLKPFEVSQLAWSLGKFTLVEFYRCGRRFDHQKHVICSSCDFALWLCQGRSWRIVSLVADRGQTVFKYACD